MDIEAAITLLTELRMEESANLTAEDPNNQKSVDREIAKATQDIQNATDSLTVGRLDVGMREYAKAWQHAANAETEALRLPIREVFDSQPDSQAHASGRLATD